MLIFSFLDLTEVVTDFFFPNYEMQNKISNERVQSPF